jgi:hypothetical protein
MPIRFDSYHQSIANFQDKREDENEDFIKIDLSSDKYACFSLCDGAGGAGVFSAEWADFLVNSIPDFPLIYPRSSKEWFANTSKNFHDRVISNKNQSDLILIKKIYRDGSYSTLCTCWLDVKRCKLSYAAVGDTYLFIFQRQGKKIVTKEIYPINEQGDIDQNPKLLNWIIEMQLDLKVKEYIIESEFIILIASDSLAKWIILNLFLSDLSSLSEIDINQEYLTSLANERILNRKEAIAAGSGVKSTEDLLLFLKEIVSDSEKFKSTLLALNNNAELEADDYSLILIEGNVS